jgi:CO dehydrogenase maturation factor
MGSGCTCPAHSVIRAILRHLVVDRDEVVILDMEAGIEHLGRGTADHVDVLLVVSDANRKSRETASAIIRLARQSSIGRILLVGNRVANLREEEILRSWAREQAVPCAASIPLDPLVAEAGIAGVPVTDPGSPARAAVASLANDLAAGAGAEPGGTPKERRP